jgi:transcriptional regulator with XRE-family HTH domain
MTLNQYLVKKGLTHEQFAELVGCTRAAVTRWASGSRSPSAKWVKVIEEKTRKKLRAEDLKAGRYNSASYNLYISILRRGLTIQQAAKQMAISRNLLAAYIKSKAVPTKAHAIKIKRHFGVII